MGLYFLAACALASAIIAFLTLRHTQPVVAVEPAE
jgi:hypothetical protein